MSRKSTKLKLAQGAFKQISFGHVHFGGLIVEGEEVAYTGKSLTDRKGKMIWDTGIFGDAMEEIEKITGQKQYNIVLQCPEFTAISGEIKVYGVLCEGGKKIVCSLFEKVCQFIWIPEEEAKEFQKNLATPADSPSHHYKMKPQNLGKLIWVTGPPGHGKSTTAYSLMKDHGFVFYEGDGFMFNLNPFIPPTEGEALDALFMQKDLNGVSKERYSIITNALFEYQKVGKEEYNIDPLNKMYEAMSEDIKKLRKKIGGDWAVCHCLPTKASRDLVRSVLGPDLVVVVLEMSKELTLERLRKREGLGEEHIQSLLAQTSVYEPAGKTEQNAIALNLTRDMTPNQVVETILSHDLLKK